MKPVARDLKSEMYADYRFGIDKVTNEFENDQFDIRHNTEVASMKNTLQRVITSDLVPFFAQLENEDTFIVYLTAQNSLQGSFDIIRYLCSHDYSSRLENYLIRLTKYLKSKKEEYNDVNTARKRVDKMISLLADLGKLTPEIKKEIEKNWEDSHL